MTTRTTTASGATRKGRAVARVAPATGFVVYDGPTGLAGESGRVVGVLTLTSANKKTGDMATLWILPADLEPRQAIATGADSAVCGSCALRGDGTGDARGCYVNLTRGPAGIWRAWRAGSYAALDIGNRRDAGILRRALRGRYARLGGWGDPVALPWHVVAAIADASAGWTGYTHQWREVGRSQWSGLLMASVSNEADRQAARAMGWRCYAAVPIGAEPPAVGAIQCPETLTGRQCRDCLACAGTRLGTRPHAVDVWITAHGQGARFV